MKTEAGSNTDDMAGGIVIPEKAGVDVPLPKKDPAVCPKGAADVGWANAGEDTKGELAWGVGLKIDGA